MTDLSVPPRTETRAEHSDTAALQRHLAARVDGEVRFDSGSPATCSTDASDFRQVPVVIDRAYAQGEPSPSSWAGAGAGIVARALVRAVRR